MIFLLIETLQESRHVNFLYLQIISILVVTVGLSEFFFYKSLANPVLVSRVIFVEQPISVLDSRYVRHFRK